jgi:DNA-binding transcriptional ArsR family regulator
MFENSPAIDLAVGRSSVRQCILALLMDEPGCRLHLREIQRRAGTSPGTASRELAKLVAAGVIDREAEGNQVYFRASTSPLATMLRSLFAVMPAAEFGPRPRRLPRTKPTRAGAPIKLAPADATAVAAAEVDEAPAAPDVLPTEIVDVELTPSSTKVERSEASVASDATARIVRPGLWTQEWPETPVAETAASAASPTAAVTAADPLGLQVAGRLAESIRSLYGESLRGIYLCGARAAGPAPADADVETIIVLDRVDHYGAELEKTSHLCAALSHEWRVVVSRVFVSEAGWDGDSTGARPPIRDEAVAV